MYTGVWGGLVGIAAWNAPARCPVLTQGLGLAAAIVLAFLAGMQAPAGKTAASAGERRVLLGILVCFLTMQVVYRAAVVRADGLEHGAQPGYSSHQGVDFGAYYLVAKAAAAGRHPELYALPLYPDGRLNFASPAPEGSDWQHAGRQFGVPFAMPFIYPPFVALLMEPLARFSYAGALAFWRGSSILLYFAAAAMLFPVCGITLSRRMLLPAGLGLLSFFPLLNQLFYGQIDSLVFVFLAGSLFLHSRNRVWAAGLCFALAALVKLTPLLLLPILVIHRQWRWLGACIGSLGVLVGISVIRFGWGAQWEFATQVLPHLGCGSPLASNVSLMGWMQEWMAGKVSQGLDAPAQLPAYACAVSRGAAFLVYAVALLRMYLLRHEQAFLRAFMAGILLTLLVSPISWWHHYMLSLLPLLYLARHGKGAVAFGARLLLLVVASNAAGFGSVAFTTYGIRLGFAAVVPALALALLGAELFGRTEADRSLYAGAELAEAARAAG